MNVRIKILFLLYLYVSPLYLATERSLSLEEFLQRLLEQPISQHYHSVSINKHQLVERYDETVRDLQLRYPSFFAKSNDSSLPQISPVRSNRTTSLPTPPVSIPIVIQQQTHRSMDNPSEILPVTTDRQDSSPMRQDDVDDSLPLPETSLSEEEHDRTCV